MKFIIFICLLFAFATNALFGKTEDFEYESPKNVLLLLKSKADKETMIKLTAIYLTWVTIAKSNALYPDSNRELAKKNAEDLLEEIKSDKAPLKILSKQYRKNATVNFDEGSYYVSIVFPQNSIATAYGPFPPFPYSEEEVKSLKEASLTE